jgi:hypothetical protein
MTPRADPFDGTDLVVDHRDYWAIIDGDRGVEPLQEAAP